MRAWGGVKVLLLLAPLGCPDSRETKPALDAASGRALPMCEARVIEALDISECTGRLAITCAVAPESFEVVVRAPLRMALGGGEGDCLPLGRRPVGKLGVVYGRLPSQDPEALSVRAGVALSPVDSDPGTVMCGWCESELRRSDGGWLPVLKSPVVQGLDGGQRPVP